MSQIGVYVLSISAGALLAAIVREMAGSGPMGRVIKYLAGLFTALTVLSLLVDVQLPDAKQWIEDFQYDGRAAAASGEEMAQDMAQEIIKNRLEAYILDKAAACGAYPVVTVRLNEEGIPESVTLQGDISRDAKLKLMRILETELGLREEDQFWSD